MIVAPQGFRRTLVLETSLPGSSSRDPGLTNRLRNRGRSKMPGCTIPACCYDIRLCGDRYGRTRIVRNQRHRLGERP